MSRDAFQIRPATDDDGGKDQSRNAGGDKSVSLLTRTLPLVENPAPHGTEDDDACHVQRPRGEPKLAHLRLAHCVEEKLEIPTCPSQRTENVVAQHWNFKIGRRRTCVRG